MPTGIIEINDAGIRAGIDGNIDVRSAGFAVLDGDTLFIGEEGQKNARLLPRWTNNRFWNQLNLDPVPNGTAAVRHHADLAFAHLEAVWQQIKKDAGQVVLAVPGFYSREQLGLLLGMAKECGIPVTGVADTSLLAVAGESDRQTIIHLDIYLHRITLSTLRADTSLTKLDTVTITETGLFALWDRWANAIASQFIQTSRYDPMHQAVSEQKLFDTLPEWISGLEDARAHSFELDVNGTRHQVAVSHEQLLSACGAIYPQIVQLVRDHIPQGGTAALLLSDRFRGFPGLKDSLTLIANTELVQLEADAVHRGAIENLERIVSASGSISHVTSLPASASVRSEPTVQPASDGERRPTHVLYNNHAVAIGTAMRVTGFHEGAIATGNDSPLCTLYTRGKETILENRKGDTVWLNGAEAPNEATLHAGDVLTIDGQSLTLISVT